MNINYDSGSSNSSEDLYDYMLYDYLEESRSMQVVEEVILSDIVRTTQEDMSEGSRNKKRLFIPRDRHSANTRLIMDYFHSQPLYNDINVLQRSPVFDDILNGQAPQVTYKVNGNTYHTGYYLTDGIYPKWAAFIDAITAPQTPKQKLFTKRQESTRKDVERAFGVLQARWAIIRQPALAWSVDLLWKIMMACIIMHNMIVEDERDEYLNYNDPHEFVEEQLGNGVESSNNDMESFVVTPGLYEERNLHDFMARREALHDRQMHTSLKNDFVEHIWTMFQGSNYE